MILDRYDGAGVEPLAERLYPAYRRVFSGPPYHSTDEFLDRFADRFPVMWARDGFQCCLAREGDAVVGFAFGLTSIPGVPWRDRIVEALEPEEAERWFDDCFELVELGVVPEWQGRGLGGALHDAVLDGRPHRTAALSTIEHETPALALYLKRGWVTLLTDFQFPGLEYRLRVMGRDLRG